MWAGHYDAAHARLQECLALYADLGDRMMQAYTQGWLSVASLGIGRYDAAQALADAAIAYVRGRQGAHSGMAFELHYGGWVALALGRYREAAALLGESVAIHRRTGNLGQLNWPLAKLGFVHWLLGDAALAWVELRDVVFASVRQHALLPLLLALPALALILAEQGQAERAVELYALAWRYPALSGAQSSHAIYGQRLEAVAAALPPAQADAARERGRQLDLWATAGALAEQMGG